MKLEYILNNPIQSYLYLERYVNDGSISGFDKINTTSLETNPYYGGEDYYLYIVELKDNIQSMHYGVNKYFNNNNDLIIHPDMKNNEIIKYNARRITRSNYKVVPIAGARTVYLLPENSGYFKLNYDGILGRIRRQLSKNHAISSIEISEILEKSIKNRKLPQKFKFLRESEAKVFNLLVPNNVNCIYEWGIVYREPIPYPFCNEFMCLVPAFSLFSCDQKNNNDPPILIQLINNSFQSPIDYFINEIVYPLIEIYFSVLINCGLQLECHSQNFLISLDRNGNIDGIVIRDLESIDKDISLCKDLQLNYNFSSSPYKIMRRNDYNYQIKHSFMFDFKFGEYFLSPCIELLCRTYNLEEKSIQSRIKEISKYYIKYLPKDFFPQDCWYDYENVLFKEKEKRPYRKNSNLKYR